MIDTGAELLEERQKHRRTVVRQALTYTPAAVVVLVLLGISLVSIAGGSYGAIIPAVVLGLVALALVSQSVAALRDLFAEPTTTTGTIRRAWSKGMLLGFFRSYYVLVSRAVFDVGVVVHAQVQEGDRLEVTHWPHSKTVISVRKLRADRSSQRMDGPGRDPVEENRGSVDAALERFRDASRGPYPPLR